LYHITSFGTVLWVRILPLGRLQTFWSAPNCSASATVSGSFSFNVSGKNIPENPPKTANTAMITYGRLWCTDVPFKSYHQYRFGNCEVTNQEGDVRSHDTKNAAHQETHRVSSLSQASRVNLESLQINRVKHHRRHELHDDGTDGDDDHVTGNCKTNVVTVACVEYSHDKTYAATTAISAIAMHPVNLVYFLPMASLKYFPRR
jgi:hypothetical protein